MLKKEIEELFKKLKISEDSLPKYSDPYSFAEQIKKASAVQNDAENIGYSTGTGSMRKE